MKIGRVLSYVRRAIQDYEMIEQGDRIAVGVSGGKDSLCLLYGLSKLRRFYPVQYDLCAITVSLGFEGMDLSPVAELCKQLDVPYHIVKTDIAEIVFDERKEKNPCSLCAKMRKGALNDKAVALGFNKVALGHNRNDVIETFFLSLFYEGRLNTFSPNLYMDRKKVFTIRPLIYLPESDVKGFVKRYDIKTVQNACPVDGYTKRQQMKQFIKDKCQDDPFFEEKIFSAVQSGGISGWQKK